MVLAGAVLAFVLLTGDDGTSAAAPTAFVADAPWRLQVTDQLSGDDTGCSVSTAPDTINPPGLDLPQSVYGTAVFQIHQTGEFSLVADHPAPGCQLEVLPGGGEANLPFTMSTGDGDSSAFRPPAAIEVQVREFNGSDTCDLALRDLTSGVDIDVATATHDAPTVRLDSGGREQVYLGANDCQVRIAAAP